MQQNTQYKKISNKIPPVVNILNTLQMFWGASYYGMFGLIVIYLSKHLDYSESTTMIIIGAFGALGPILAALGGLCNDRILGARRSLLVGWVLYTIAYLILAYAAYYKINTLSLLSLALISFARGLSTTNICSLISKAYVDKSNPSLMETSYTYNYMLNNLGSFIARISFPIFLAYISYWGTFALSGALIFINVIIMFIYKDILKNYGTDPDFKPLSLKIKILFFIGGIFIIGLAYLSFNYLDITKNVVYGLGILAFAFFLFEITKATTLEKRKMFVAVILLLETLLFFVYYNLLYTAVIFYAVNTMEHSLFGIPFNPIATAAFNPFWVALSSPIIAYIFLKLEKNNINLSIFTKFAVGMIFTTLAFFTLYLSTKFLNIDTGKISSLWFLLVHLLQAVGEVLISALGIAALVRLVSTKSSGFIVGLRTVTLSVTSIFSAVLAGKVALPNNQDISNLETVMPMYGDFFKDMGSIAIIAVIIIIILIPVNKFLLKSVGEKF